MVSRLRLFLSRIQDCWKESWWVVVPHLVVQRGQKTSSGFDGDPKASRAPIWLVRLLECFGLYLWPTVAVFELLERQLYTGYHVHLAVAINGKIKRSRCQIPWTTPNSFASSKFAARLGPRPCTYYVVLTNTNGDVQRSVRFHFVGVRARRDLLDTPLY